MDTAEDLREIALRQIKKRTEFRSHLAVYLLVNVLLWAIWLVIGIFDGFSFPWAVFVTGGWGLAVLISAWDTYGRTPITEQDVQTEMRRLEQRR